MEIDLLTLMVMAEHTPGCAVRLGSAYDQWSPLTYCASCAECRARYLLEHYLTVVLYVHAPLWWEKCYACDRKHLDDSTSTQTPPAHTGPHHAMVPYTGTGDSDGSRDG